MKWYDMLHMVLLPWRLYLGAQRLMEKYFSNLLNIYVESYVTMRKKWNFILESMWKLNRTPDSIKFFQNFSWEFIDFVQRSVKLYILSHLFLICFWILFLLWCSLHNICLLNMLQKIKLRKIPPLKMFQCTWFVFVGVLSYILARNICTPHIYDALC